MRGERASADVATGAHGNRCAVAGTAVATAVSVVAAGVAVGVAVARVRWEDLPCATTAILITGGTMAADVVVVGGGHRCMAEGTSGKNLLDRRVVRR